MHPFLHPKTPSRAPRQILSYLTVPEIKALSLTCAMLNSDCFPFVFRNLSLHGDHRPAPKFFADFKDRTPAVPCLRKLTLNELNEDISNEILPWSTLVRNAKFSGGHLGNLTILPSLKLLQVLELVKMAIQSRSDYFGVLSTIPPSVRDPRLRNNTFLHKLPFPHPVTRKIEVEQLTIKTATDLSLLLEDYCPISFRSLRVASIGHPKLHDIRNLVQRSPRLVDLTIFVRKSERGQSMQYFIKIPYHYHLNTYAPVQPHPSSSRSVA